MKHFRTILATTDLSPESLSTVRYAIHLAKSQNASVVVLHVPPVPSIVYPEALLPIDLSALADEVEQLGRKRLERWIKRYESTVTIKAVVRRGIVHDTIRAVAREVRANLIVMSTHGRRGVRHLLLGSVTERVLRDAPCPVLVVKPLSGAATRRGPVASRLKRAA
jgi:nucleotide-binding universal stress UspA family protein